VEFIFPDYPKTHVDPTQGSGETEDVHVYTTECFKLVLKEPYSGNNYSVTFKPKTSLNTLYYVITKMELAKQNDSTITFNHYYSIRKGNRIIMTVGMNVKAVEMVSNHNNYL